jgi:hypothetical protein
VPGPPWKLLAAFLRSESRSRSFPHDPIKHFLLDGAARRAEESLQPPTLTSSSNSSTPAT